MHIVLCHTTADFDTLGAAVGAACLQPGSRIVLTGGSHPAVHRFLAIHRDEYPFIERRAVAKQQIASLTLVDAYQKERLGAAADWVDFAIAAELPITIYDHHPAAVPDIPGTYHIEPVGAATTLVAEALQRAGKELSPTQATVMALGIHADTGSLTFNLTTARDALALAWLMEQGAHQGTIAEFASTGLSDVLQTLLTAALDSTEVQVLGGHSVGSVLLTTEKFVPGLSGLAEHLSRLLGLDTFLLACAYTAKHGPRLTLIARTRPETGVDCRELLLPYGGGGHGCAASANVATEDCRGIFRQLVTQLQTAHPAEPDARSLMSAPVRTIRPATTIAAAQRILLRYGHSGLCVVDEAGELVGVISRRDIDLALRHGFAHAPVKGYMAVKLKTIPPHTSLQEIQSLMVTYDIGRLPVVDADHRLVGIVTRSDVLRQQYQSGGPTTGDLRQLPPTNLYDRLQEALHHYRAPTPSSQRVWDILLELAKTAEHHGWHLYVVGGAVRDLLLNAEGRPALLKDIDLVVDSFQATVVEGAGVVIAQQLQQRYPEADVQIHGEFQTAALVWHAQQPGQPSLMVDIATARTEFYPYPAANPEVEASSIRQDLYRRDFTINAMAIRLTAPNTGRLLDFFGGWLDLHHRQVRVLHANSFIEDPTRIFRAVRFAVRLKFDIESQTENFIRYAIDSGVYRELQSQSTKRLPALQTRLRAELKYILQEQYWPQSLGLLDKLGAFQCLHPELAMDRTLWQQVHRVGRWRQRFIELAADRLGVDAWLMRLEVLLSQVEARSQVASRLELPLGSIERLRQLPEVETHLLDCFQSPLAASAVYQTLAAYELPLLLLASVRHPKAIGAHVWRYVSQLMHCRPPLNGHDLKQLGYPPGPQYRDMLRALTYAALDGEITSSAAAKEYLRQFYPLAHE